MADRFYEDGDSGARRTAPAAARNREPIGAVLDDWLPETGTVLEIASGTGEHAVAYAVRYPHLRWQPSDRAPDALDSIAAWRGDARLANLQAPLAIDVTATDWGIDRADAIFCANMVHISPWKSALGLLDGAARLLPPDGRLILYGPWIEDRVETATGNRDFDADLRRRNPDWGLRRVECFAGEARARGLALCERRAMPASNLMLLFAPERSND